MSRAKRAISPLDFSADLRKRSLVGLLAAAVRQQQMTADWALEQGDLERASVFQEAAAVSAHHLALLEEEMRVIVGDHRDGPAFGVVLRTR